MIPTVAGPVLLDTTVLVDLQKELRRRREGMAVVSRNERHFGRVERLRLLKY
jgi:predicted nucleic acid-binding protein